MIFCMTIHFLFLGVGVYSLAADDCGKLERQPRFLPEALLHVLVGSQLFPFFLLRLGARHTWGSRGTLGHELQLGVPFGSVYLLDRMSGCSWLFI